MSSLTDRLDEFKKTFESESPLYNVTPDRVATMHGATDELKASGVEGRALKIDDHARDFARFNQDHVEVSSRDLLQQGR